MPYLFSAPLFAGKAKSLYKPAVRTAALGLAATMLLSGCASGSDTPVESKSASGAEPVAGGTIHVLQKADFSYLDPTRGWDTGVAEIQRLLFRGLTTRAAGDSENPSDIVPDLATDLGKVSEDGLTWTYTLKDGLYFDNGEPITAEAVKFGISRSWDPKIGIGSTFIKDKVAAPKDYEGPYASGELSTIETPDDKTIVFHLKEPFAEFPAVLAQPNGTPFPVGSGKGNEFINDVIASGPYTLEEYVPGTKIVLERNEHWKQDTDDVRHQYPETFEFNMGIDPATISERLMADQGADVNAISGGIAKEAIARVFQDPKLEARTLTAPGECTSFMAMNTKSDKFKDVRVRQAVNWALDRDMVVSAVGGNKVSSPTTTIIPSSVNGHLDYDLYPGPDEAKAKELLADAGVPDGFSFTLDVDSYDVQKDRGIAIQESLSSVGIDVKLNVIDSAVFYETVQTPKKMNDAVLASWCPDWSSSASTFIEPLFSTSAITPQANQNYAQFSDPVIDTEISAVSKLTDMVEANKRWGALDKAIMEQAPWAPLTVGQNIWLPGSNIAGFHPTASLLDLAIIGLSDPTEGN